MNSFYTASLLALGLSLGTLFAAGYHCLTICLFFFTLLHYIIRDREAS